MLEVKSAHRTARPRVRMIYLCDGFIPSERNEFLSAEEPGEVPPGIFNRVAANHNQATQVGRRVLQGYRHGWALEYESICCRHTRRMSAPPIQCSCHSIVWSRALMTSHLGFQPRMWRARELSSLSARAS